MKKVLIIAVLVGLVQCIFAQYELISPRPAGNTLRHVVFANENLGVIGGNEGTLLYTENGGQSWQVAMTGSVTPIYDLLCYNGVFYATNGNVYSSADGKHWELMFANPTYPIISLSFADNSTVYALTAHSYGNHFGVSHDGGKHWQFSNIGIPPDYMERFTTSYTARARIRFADSQTGYIIVEDYLLSTRDGGATWKRSDEALFYLADGGHLTDIAIIDHQTALATLRVHGEGGEDYAVFARTADKGLTWQTSWNSDIGLNLAFTDAQHGYMLTMRDTDDYGMYYAQIAITQDGGQSWEFTRIADTLFCRMEYCLNYFGLAQNAPGQFVVVGENGEIIRTADNGQTWQKITETDFYSIDFIAPLTENRLIASFYTNPYQKFMYISEDEGRTWQKATNFDFSKLTLPCLVCNGTYFFRDNQGWIIDVNKYLYPDTVITYYTNDGGQTWTVNKWKNNTGGHLTIALTGVTPDGLMYGPFTPSGQLLVSQNNGQSWEVRNLPTEMGSNFLRFIDKNNGVMYSSEVNASYNSYFKTHDGGLTWEESPWFLNTIYNGYIRNISFTSDGTGILWILSQDFQGNPLLEAHLSHDTGTNWEKHQTIPGEVGIFTPNPDGSCQIVTLSHKIFTMEGEQYYWATDDFTLPNDLFYAIRTGKGNYLIYNTDRDMRILKTGQAGLYGLKDQSPLAGTGVKVSPNPASDHLTIEWEPWVKPEGWAVYNPMGQLVSTWAVNQSTGGNKLSVSLASLKPGLYLLKSIGNQTFSVKFIVK